MGSVLLRAEAKPRGKPSIRELGTFRLTDSPTRNTRSLMIPNAETEIEPRRRSPYVNPSKLICLSRKPNHFRLAALPLYPARISDTVVPPWLGGSPEWKKSLMTNSSPFLRLISVSPPAPSPLFLHGQLPYSQNNPKQLVTISILPTKTSSTSVTIIPTPTLSRATFARITASPPLKPNDPIGSPDLIPRMFWSAPEFGWPRRGM